MAEHEYLNLDLSIGPGSVDGTYRARITQSPAGEADSQNIALPVSDQEVESLLFRIGRARSTRNRGPRGSGENAARDFGARLFNQVFDASLLPTLRQSMTLAHERDFGLRIRLRLTDSPELCDIPWEYLYDSVSRDYLAQSTLTPIVRYLEMPAAHRRLPLTSPLQILVMVSSPKDVADLDTEREWLNLCEALRPLVDDRRVNLTRVGGSRRDLRTLLRRRKFHVFHFIGHGEYDSDVDDSYLYLESDDGRLDRTRADELGVILHDHLSMRLVVLNSCEGARSSRHDPYSGTAQTLALKGVPAVVAMQFEISDEAAIAFSQSFYEAIAEGYPVDGATTEGRKAVLDTSNPVEWGTPVLYLRTGDPNVFDHHIFTPAGRVEPENMVDDRIQVADMRKPPRHDMSDRFQGFIASPGVVGNRPTSEEPRRNGIRLSKTADPIQISGGAAGMRIVFHFKVTNTGFERLTDVQVSDSVAPPMRTEYVWPGPPGILEPGQVLNATSAWTITNDDVVTGAVTGSATAVGIPPTGQAVYSDPEWTTTRLF